MERQEQNLEELSKRFSKTEAAINRCDMISNTIGTEMYQGLPQYMPPIEGQPNYLKDMVATTLLSSGVKKTILEETIPYLRNLRSQLQEKINEKQNLLSQIQEYQAQLSQLYQFQQEGYLTNSDAIVLVEWALSDAQTKLMGERQPENTPEQEQAFEKTAQPDKDSGSVTDDGLELLTTILENCDIQQFDGLINAGRSQRISIPTALKRVNGIFTKLYYRVQRNEANEKELRVWQKIYEFTPYLDPNLVKESFRDEINRYVSNGPRVDQVESQITLVKSKKEQKPRREFDAYDVVDGEIEKIRARNNGIIDMRQTFKPRSAMEVFNFDHEDDDRLKENGVLKLDQANDHHDLFTFEEGLVTTLLKKRNWTTQQREEIHLAILERVEKWKNDNPLSSGK